MLPLSAHSVDCQNPAAQVDRRLWILRRGFGGRPELSIEQETDRRGRGEGSTEGLEPPASSRFPNSLTRRSLSSSVLPSLFPSSPPGYSNTGRELETSWSVGLTGTQTGSK